MKRYVSQQRTHIELLDFCRTETGFDVHFARRVGDMPVAPQTSFTRAKHTLRDAIGRLERLGADQSRNDAQRHDAARQLYERAAAGVRAAAKDARAWADAEAQEAHQGMNAVLAPEPGKGALYSEIRAHAASRKADADWPAELSRLVRTNRDVAVAVANAPGFLSGIGDDRQRDLSIAAMRAHAPAEADRLLVADQVREEAERVESGLSKIKPAFYAEAIAGQMNTHVDVAAPFATGPIVNAAE